MPVLVFTGGGTAGHVMPNLALAPELRARGWTLHYVGSTTGPEKALAEGAGIPFHAIATGKLRRYFAWRNFTDPLRVIGGFFQAFALLGRIRPDVVFSKGGFVAVPVAYAARLRGIPVVLHESDLTPGLANRLCLPFCRTVCVSFPETLDHLPKGKGVLTGSPIRPELASGVRARGLAWLGFVDGPSEKPALLVTGGSLGAAALNAAVRDNLDWITGEFRVIHLCGGGRTAPALEGRPDYRQFEFVGAELGDVLAAADFVISRAGANSLFELLALRKPMLLIPLPAGASRGDQILNAESFARRGLARVLRQENLGPETLRDALGALARDAETLKGNMAASDLGRGIGPVLAAIEDAVRTVSRT